MFRLPRALFAALLVAAPSLTLTGCDEITDELSDYTDAPISITIDVPQELAIPYPTQDGIANLVGAGGGATTVVALPEVYQRDIDLLAADTSGQVEANKSKIRKIEIQKVRANVIANGFPTALQPIELRIGSSTDTWDTATIAGTLPSIPAGQTGTFSTDPEQANIDAVSDKLVTFRVGMGIQTGVEVPTDGLPDGSELRMKLSVDLKITVNPLE